jgi:2-polyprenyl-3-methyl-5-hydroxy-6-metoxy-1,4-benzoquinol methylase
VQDLKEHLASYDLVVTQFGLTAFEAAWAGCAVLLLNPSRYHQALSRVSGFPECGVRSFRPKALKNALADTSRLVKAAIEAAPRRKVDLAAFIRSLNPSGLGSCPACGSLRRAAIARYARKTYFRCKDCDLVFMEYFAQREDSYQASYFFGEYERQYGKTYLEDFPALAAMAARRLDIIESLPASGKARSVVDVGCAYGAFLSESSRRGWKSFGLDLVPEAVEYVRKKLGIAAAVADFQDPSTASLLPHDLDCLSMWYVVEHFQDPGSVLETVASLLRPGGIFAFSTPSRSGISARSNPVSFFERSPDDHWTILGPGRVASILKRFGLRVMRIRITGHHPERFGKVPARPGSLKFRFFGLVSRIFALGDTFECYAVKEKER